MPAYVIALIDVTDREQYSKYTQVTPGVIAQFGGRFIIRGGKTVTLEGPEEKRRMVVIEFPSFETAQAFYHSEEYQEAKKLRNDAAIGTFIVAEGCVPNADNFETIRHHFEGDRFAATSGMRLLELLPGYAKTSMTVEDRHLNSIGTVHGGAIFTLADFAFGAAVKTGGKVAPAISTTLSFLKATRSGTLYAEATEISRSRKLSVCTVRVTNDAGELVALFQGTAYIKDEPFPPEQPASHTR